METRANYLMVGVFVLALAIGLVGFVVWFGKFQFDRQFTRYDILVEGSVTGLNLGGPVRYSGVRVGEVIDIRLEPERPHIVRVTVEVNADTPVREDTVASLELEGLTGGLYVLLSSGSDEAARLLPKEGEKLAVIASRASSLEQILQGAPELLKGATQLIANGNQLLNPDNQARFAEILDNSSRFTGKLADQGEAIDRLFADAAATMENLRQASVSVQQLAETVEQDSAELFGQANDTLVAAEELARSLESTAGAAQVDINRLANDLGGTAKSITGVADEVRFMVAENREQIRDFTSIGLYELSTLISEARGFLVGLNRVTTEVQRDPARFLFGNQQQGYEANQ
jgi:phospholipid/cholesterol/gamma-HCH transport system substrate-binding protein